MNIMNLLQTIRYTLFGTATDIKPAATFTKLRRWAAAALSRSASVAVLTMAGLCVLPVAAQAQSADIFANVNAPASVVAGTTTTLDVAIGSLGSAIANGMVVTVPIPANLSNVTLTCTGGTGSATCANLVGLTYSGGNVTATVNGLAGGSTVKFQIAADVSSNPNGPLSYDNTVTVSSPTNATDPSLANNTSTQGTAVTYLKQCLTFSKTTSTKTLAVGTPVNYVVTVSNAANPGCGRTTGFAFTDVIATYQQSSPADPLANPSITVDYSSTPVVCSGTGGFNCATATLVDYLPPTFNINSLASMTVANLTLDPGQSANYAFSVTPTKVTINPVSCGIGEWYVNDYAGSNFGLTLNTATDKLPIISPGGACAAIPNIDVAKSHDIANLTLPGVRTTTVTYTNTSAIDYSSAVHGKIWFRDLDTLTPSNGQAVLDLSGSTVTCVADPGAVCPSTVNPFTPSSAYLVTPGTQLYEFDNNNITDVVIPAGKKISFIIKLDVKGSLCGGTVDTYNWALVRNVSGASPGLYSTVRSDVYLNGKFLPDPLEKACVDLGVTKSNIGTGIYSPGQPMSFAVDIANSASSGFSAAQDVSFVDPLPAAFNYVSSSCTVITAPATCPPAINYTAATNTLDAVIPSVGAGGKVRITINGTATNEPALWGNGINKVDIPASNGKYKDLAPSSNQGQSNFIILGKSDLAITKTNSVASYVPGGTTRYTIVMSNQGPDTAIDSLLKDPAVPNLTVTAVSCPSATSGSVSPLPANTTVALLQGTGVVIPRLTNGGTVTCYVDATVSATATGPIKNVATIQLPANGYILPESDITNNTASDTDFPAPVLTKAFAPNVITAGGISKLTFSITNPAGNPAITGISFTDNLPANLIIATPPLVNNLCTPGGLSSASAGSSTITFTGVGVLAATAGAPNTCTITVNVTNVDTKLTPAAERAACLANTITPGNTDFTNKFSKMSGIVNVVNGVTDQCLVVDPAVPTVEKSFNPTTIAGGSSTTAAGITTLTFVLKNPKTNPATTVTFTDTLPASLTIATPSSIGGTCTNATTGAVATTASGGVPARINATAVALAAGGAAGSECTVTIAVTAIPNVTNATCPEAGGATNFTNSASNISNNSNVGTTVSTAPMVPSCVTVTGAVNLNMAKTASTTSPQIGVPFSYSLRALNAGSVDTSGLYYIADDIDASRLNVTAAPAGTGWTCTSPAAGTAYPITSGIVQVRCSSSAVITPTSTSSALVISVTPSAAAATGLQPIVNLAAVGGVGTTPTTATAGGGGSSTTGEQSNTVNNTPNTNPNNPLTNVGQLDLTFTGKVDLLPTKTVSNSAQAIGTAYTYGLSVANIGSIPSNAVVTLIDAIPANIRLDSMTVAAGWSCSSLPAVPATAPTVTCTSNVGTVVTQGAAATNVVTLNVTPLVGAVSPTTNTVTASGGGENPADTSVTGNNTSSVPVTFATGKMGLAKALMSVTPALAGGVTVPNAYTMTYRYKVRNDGAGSLPNVQIKDDLIAAFGAAVQANSPFISLVAGSNTCPAPTAAPAAWTINPLFNGTSNTNFFTLPNAGLAAAGCEAVYELSFVLAGVPPVSGLTGNTVSALSYDNRAVTTSQIDATNPATLLATDKSTNSKTLDPKQGNAAVDANQPVNDSPTPVLLPSLGLAKAAGNPVQASPTQFDMPYTIKVKNTGGTILDPVTVTDNLATTYPGLTTAIVAGPAASVTTPGNCAALAPYFGATTEAAAANAAYNGQAVTGLLAATGSKLCPGGEITITFTVRITDPVAGTVYNNLAVGAGKGSVDPTDPFNPLKSLTVFDTSTNGGNVDPNGDGIPSEQVPTPTTFTPQKVDVAKAVGVPLQTGPSSFAVPYTVVVKNTGTAPATNVQVDDNLAATFATGAPVLNISTLAATAAPCTINPTAFNGVANPRLLAGTDTLAVGASCTITFTVNVAYPSVAAIPPAAQTNSAVANTYTAPPATPGGTPTGTPVSTDTSTTGTAPPAGSPPGTAPVVPTPVPGDTPTPTPVSFAAQKIDVVKAAGVPTQVGPKVFEVPYTIVVGNVGATSPTVYNVQAQDNLSNVYPAPATVTIKPASYTVATNTGGAVCTPAAPAYSNAAPYNLLSGADDLTGGQSCVVKFIAVVDYGTAAVDSTPRLNTTYASGMPNNSTANLGYTLPVGGAPVPPTGASTTDASVTSHATPTTTGTTTPPGGTAGTGPTTPTLPATPGGDAPTGAPTPVVLVPQQIDVVKSAGVPAFIPAASFDVPYAIVVGNKGATSATNFQAVENLAATFPGATLSWTAAPVIAPVGSTPAANCAANPAFVASPSASNMFSGQQTLATGQACSVTFVVRVVYPSLAAMPTTVQNNTVTATTYATAAAAVGGTGTGPRAVDVSTDVAPPAGGTPGALPPLPALPATPNVDTPKSTPVILVIPVAKLLVTKSASKTTAEVGDTVTYTVTIKRTDTSALLPSIPVYLMDTLPVGFTYIPGTLTATTGNNGSQPVSQTDSVVSLQRQVMNVALPFPAYALNNNGNTVTVTYRVRIGVGAMEGGGVNRVQGKTGANVDCQAEPNKCSNEARATVKVNAGVFTPQACVIGKVYVDCNQNGIQDNEEIGIPGVRLYLLDGTNVITDVEGKYSICDLKPQTHVIAVDRKTMPRGSIFGTTSNRNALDGSSLFMDLKKGELHRADFTEASCANPIIEQVKARRAQGEVRAKETEHGRSPAAADNKGLKYQDKPIGNPVETTDGANQPAIKVRQ